ncbi:MAG: hypothetical protein PW734_04615 [Verrucomicrobium sp.]|nr:hypothetical protein [Verrucomicrobium sp.]
MILTIDSKTVDLPRQPDEALTAYLDRVADLLIKEHRSIGTCLIDGQAVTLDAQGQRLFAGGKEMQVESVPLLVALQANIAFQCNALRRMEGECETLITDSLLVEPVKVAAAWNVLCEAIKGGVEFLRVLEGLLTKEEVDLIVDDKLAKLGQVMKEIAAIMAKGDVVGFSDQLEMQLLPWLADFRKFLEGQVERVDALIAKQP